MLTAIEQTHGACDARYIKIGYMINRGVDLACGDLALCSVRLLARSN